MTTKTRPPLSIRLDLAPGVQLGPGKADVLEGIAETGSIAASGRRLSMSYKRVWGIVEELNRLFDEPLVSAAKGGKAGGGAALTDLGINVLARYRRIQEAATKVATTEVAALRRRLATRD